MKSSQQQSVALITGAARRIGKAITEHLHQQGFNVVIHCHTSVTNAHDLAEQLTQKRANSASVFQANLCDSQAINELIKHCITWAGRLDLLVNNASVFYRDNNDWDTLFTTNVKAPYWLSFAAYPHLKHNQGAIINITDIHAEQPMRDYNIYCQSKAALAMQTKAFAQQFAPEVRVNAVAPGSIIWPEHENTLKDQIKSKIIEKTWLKRHGDPSWIAHAVYALAENKFITGQTIRVDGGRY